MLLLLEDKEWIIQDIEQADTFNQELFELLVSLKD